MNATGDSDLENWYNYLERIQSRMVRKNLRYLLSVVFQAGVACGEVDEVPDIKIEFNPLWSMSESEKATIDQQKAQTQQVKAQTAQIYMDAQVIDPSEVRRKLADSDEFDIESLLDEYDSEEDLFANMLQGGDDDMLMGGGAPGEQEQTPQENPPLNNANETQGEIPESGGFDKYAEGVDVEEHNTDPGTEGSAPTTAPAATKLPEDMSEEELKKAAEKNDSRADADGSISHADTPPNRAKSKATVDSRLDNTLSTLKPKNGSVGVLVVKDGLILTGTRTEGDMPGTICGPGGHVEDGETFEQAAIRETQEEFGITPKAMLHIGYGEWNENTGLKPAIFLATEYDGEIKNTDGEMGDLRFRSLRELQETDSELFQPFANSIEVLLEVTGGGHFDGCSEVVDNDDSDSRSDGIMSLSELEVAFQTMNNKGYRKTENTFDKSAKSVIINEEPLTCEAIKQALSTDEIDFLADEFGFDFNTASDEDLQDLYGLLRNDGAPKGNQNAAGPHKKKGSASETPKQFKTTNGTMEITSDLSVKASKSGKTTVTLKAGNKMERIYSFAGKGADKNLVVAGFLSKQYGGQPNEWSHKCGFAPVIAPDGTEENAEIHWFEHDEIGQIKFKVKYR